MSEDARYDPTPGGMEWGTDKGDNYYRSLTPGQTPKNRKAPLKPLPIKARKPEDEKAEEVDNTFLAKRGKQLSPAEKAKANKDYKQRARDEIKKRSIEEGY